LAVQRRTIGRVHRETSFAALCGASPVDTSSGKQIRRRLNRGGGQLFGPPRQ
jgi:transposase IS116/IS110/IS902 family protein